jgi:hypothetical protein
VTIETLGLALAEGKLILKKVQEEMVQQQVSDALLDADAARTAAKCATAGGITTSPYGRCSATWSCRARDWPIAHASRMRKRSSVRCRRCCRSTSARNCCTWK